MDWALAGGWVAGDSRALPWARGHRGRALRGRAPGLSRAPGRAADVAQLRLGRGDLDPARHPPGDQHLPGWVLLRGHPVVAGRSLLGRNPSARSPLAVGLCLGGPVLRRRRNTGAAVGRDLVLHPGRVAAGAGPGVPRPLAPARPGRALRRALAEGRRVLVAPRRGGAAGERRPVLPGPLVHRALHPHRDPARQPRSATRAKRLRRRGGRDLPRPWGFCAWRASPRSTRTSSSTTTSRPAHPAPQLRCSARGGAGARGQALSGALDGVERELHPALHPEHPGHRALLRQGGPLPAAAARDAPAPGRSGAGAPARDPPRPVGDVREPLEHRVPRHPGPGADRRRGGRARAPPSGAGRLVHRDQHRERRDTRLRRLSAAWPRLLRHPHLSPRPGRSCVELPRLPSPRCPHDVVHPSGPDRARPHWRRRPSRLPLVERAAVCDRPREVRRHLRGHPDRQQELRLVRVGLQRRQRLRRRRLRLSGGAGGLQWRLHRAGHRPEELRQLRLYLQHRPGLQPGRLPGLLLGRLPDGAGRRLHRQPRGLSAADPRPAGRAPARRARQPARGVVPRRARRPRLGAALRRPRQLQPLRDSDRLAGHRQRRAPSAGGHDDREQGWHDPAVRRPVARGDAALRHHLERQRHPHLQRPAGG